MAGFVKIPGMTRRIGLTVAALAAALTALQAAPATVALVVDRRHRRDHGQRAPGSAARRRGHRRRPHCRRRHAGGDRQPVHRGPGHRRDRQDRDPRPRQHPRSCADGALSRPGRRPGADGVAGEVHLPRRSEDGVARDGRDRHQAGRARDDPERHDDVCRHVLLRRGDCQDRQGGRTARRPRPDDHQISRRRCEDPAGGVGPQRGVPQGIQGRPAHHGGRGAAFGVHARQGDAAGVPRSRNQVPARP